MPTILGTNTSETLIGDILGDVIKGRGGDDILLGRSGNDRIVGGSGLDVLYDGDGRDKLKGGADKDAFVLRDDGDKDVILDYEDGLDVIVLEVEGVDDFSDLSLTQLSNGRVRVDYGNDHVIIKGAGGQQLSVSDFTADDFILGNYNRTELDFEDLVYPSLNPGPNDTTFGGQLLGGYGGFTWSSSVFGVEGEETPASGLDNSSGSGDNAIVNGFAAPIAFTKSAPFDLEQIEMGALYRDGLEVTIQGRLDGQVIGSQTVTLDTTGSTTVRLDDTIFDVVDAVTFVPTQGSGIENPSYSAVGPNEHFYLDDIVVFA